MEGNGKRRRRKRDVKGDCTDKHPSIAEHAFRLTFMSRFRILKAMSAQLLRSLLNFFAEIKRNPILRSSDVMKIFITTHYLRRSHDNEIM